MLLIVKKKKFTIKVYPFDFSAFSTNLPHPNLIGVLHELVKFSFDGGCKD